MVRIIIDGEGRGREVVETTVAILRDKKVLLFFMNRRGNKVLK